MISNKILIVICFCFVVSCASIPSLSKNEGTETNQIEKEEISKQASYII